MSDTRRVLRQSVRGFRTTSNVTAASLLILDVALFVTAFGCVLVCTTLPTKLAAGTVAGLAIVRLFVLGHDACHRSFFSSRAWNRRVARLVFLPSLTTYSLWEAGHNLGHHVFTNLRGRDYVWAPGRAVAPRLYQRNRHLTQSCGRRQICRSWGL